MGSSLHLGADILVEVVRSAPDNSLVHRFVSLGKGGYAIRLKNLDRALWRQIAVADKDVPPRRRVRRKGLWSGLGRVLGSQANRSQNQHCQTENPAQRFQNMRAHAFLLRKQAKKPMD